MIVKVSEPLPPLTWAVSLPSPPSSRGRCRRRGSRSSGRRRAWPKTWSSAGAAGQRVVARAAEQQVVTALAGQRVVTLLAEEQVVAAPPVSVSLPSPPNMFALGRAPLVSSSADGVVAPLAEDLEQAGVGDRGDASRILMAPPLTRIFPAASRETTMVLSCASPSTVSTPWATAKVAVTAGRTRRSRSSSPANSTGRTRRDDRRRTGQLV